MSSLNNIFKPVLSNFATTELRKVAGNLPGMLGLSSGQTSAQPAAKLQNYSAKFSTQNLSFPLDVEAGTTRGNHGHYIMFYINENEKARLSMSGRETIAAGTPFQKETGAGSIVEGRKQLNLGKFQKQFNTAKQTYETVQNENIDAEQQHTQMEKAQKAEDAVLVEQGFGIAAYKTSAYKGSGSTMTMKRNATKRLQTAIAMYMPTSVSTSYGAEYTDTEMGGGTRNALALYDALGGEDYTGMTRALLDFDEPIREGAIKAVLTTLGAIPGLGGLRESEAAREGRIIANRMELAFKAIDRRSFTYTFKMIPRSARESEEISKIVNAFKANMLPEFTGGNRVGRKFTIPNTFDISYMYQGKENEFLHKISTCVLEKMDVTYGGDRYKTFEATTDGAPPVETSIALTFKEMEMITRERVFEGF